MSYGRMVKEERRLQAEIGALLKRAEAVDEAEDARYGEDARGDELPEELKRREDRLAAIRAAKARLAAEQRAMDDARGRKPGPVAPTRREASPTSGSTVSRTRRRRATFTDPESRIMKTSSEGFQQCYNAQTVVGRGQPGGGGDDGDGQRERPGPADPDGRRGEGRIRRDAGAGAGGRGLLQRTEPGRP